MLFIPPCGGCHLLVHGHSTHEARLKPFNLVVKEATHVPGQHSKHTAQHAASYTHECACFMQSSKTMTLASFCCKAKPVSVFATLTLQPLAAPALGLDTQSKKAREANEAQHLLSGCSGGSGSSSDAGPVCDSASPFVPALYLSQAAAVSAATSAAAAAAAAPVLQEALLILK